MPIVHFEIEGRDGRKLQRFYSELFNWSITVGPDNPAHYGVVAREENLGATGVGIGGPVSSVPEQPSTTWRGPSRDGRFRVLRG